MSRRNKRINDTIIEIDDEDNDLSDEHHHSLQPPPQKSSRKYDQLDDANLSIFAHRSFRAGQREVIEATLAKRDCFVIMVTIF